MLREIRDNQIRLKQNVQRALTSKPSSNAYKFAGPGTSEDLGKSAAQSIVDISKEYAFNTMLKAELRKNKPSVPGEQSYGLSSRGPRTNLSPSYMKARTLSKTISEMSNYMTTRTALLNA